MSIYKPQATIFTAPCGVKFTIWGRTAAAGAVEHVRSCPDCKKIQSKRPM